MPLKGYTMRRKVVELGSATAKTKDFTGWNWWDGFLFDWRRWIPYG